MTEGKIHHHVIHERIRLSPHLFNNRGDVDAALAPRLGEIEEEAMNDASIIRTGAVTAEAERAVSVDLAACYRLIAHYGMTDLIYTHISARVPGTHDQSLINPFGLLFEQITASSLVKIDCDGNAIDDSPLSSTTPASSSTARSTSRGRRSRACCTRTRARAWRFRVSKMGCCR